MAYCKAIDKGGAMYLENVKNLTLKSTKIFYNNATSGGGIYFHCSDNITFCDLDLPASVRIR